MRKTNTIKLLVILMAASLTAEAQSITERVVPPTSRIRIERIELNDLDTGLEVVKLEPLPLFLEEAAMKKYGIQKAEVYIKLTRRIQDSYDDIRLDTVCLRIESNPLFYFSKFEIMQMNSNSSWGIGTDRVALDETDKTGQRVIARRTCRTEKRGHLNGGLRDFIINSEKILIVFGSISGVLTDDNVERVRRFFLTSNY